MRAKASRGTDVRFIEGNMGINQLSKIIPSLCEFLPADLRPQKVTAHSGRHTAASIAINHGVDSISVSKVTKHRDPRALAIYEHENEATRLKTAMAIGAAVTRQSPPIESDSEDLDDGMFDVTGYRGDDDEGNTSSSALKKRSLEENADISAPSSSTKKKKAIPPTINFYYNG